MSKKIKHARRKFDAMWIRLAIFGKSAMRDAAVLLQMGGAPAIQPLHLTNFWLTIDRSPVRGAKCWLSRSRYGIPVGWMQWYVATCMIGSKLAVLAVLAALVSCRLQQPSVNCRLCRAERQDPPRPQRPHTTLDVSRSPVSSRGLW